MGKTTPTPLTSEPAWPVTPERLGVAGYSLVYKAASNKCLAIVFRQDTVSHTNFF